MTQSRNGNDTIGCDNDHATQMEKQSESSIDKVREIIFGGQMRDYEHRFESLESDFRRRTTSLQKDFDKKLTNLDGFLKRELEALGNQIAQEKSESFQALTNLSNDVSTLGARLEQNLTELDTTLSSQTNELRNDMARDDAAILDETKELVQTLTDIVNRETQMLQNTKTNRSELANLLSEFATRLNSEIDRAES